MKSAQRGFTLIELILVIGLMSMAAILSFQEKQQDLEEMKAKGTGEILFQYNNAVRSWLTNNIGATTSTRHGTSWLKHTSCPGGTSSIAYLPCNFPSATPGSPIAFGNLALTSYVESSGAFPNQVTSVRSETSPFIVKNEARSNLAGISALVAAAGKTDALTPVLMASEGSFTSDPTTASITMIASNNASTDAWLRTDGSNYMNNNITFNPLRDTENREIRNISKIVSGLGGASLNSPERFIVDADQDLIGIFRVQNINNNPVGFELSRGNLNVPIGTVTAKSFRDSDSAAHYLDPNATSVLQTVNTKGAITSDGKITGKGDIEAKGNIQALRFYDANDNSFYVDPSSLSRLSDITATGNITAEQNIKVGGFVQLDKVSVEGSSCSSAGVGALSRDAAGMTLSCQSGVWKGSTGEQSCFYMTIAGSSLTFRGVGLLEGAQFSGTMLRADRPAPSYYFGYHHDCRSDTACVASRGAYVASIGGSGSFHSILHVANLPVQAASACL